MGQTNEALLIGAPPVDRTTSVLMSAILPDLDDAEADAFR